LRNLFSIFIIISSLARILLFSYAALEHQVGLYDIFKVVSFGLLNDIITFTYIGLVLSLFAFILPINRFHRYVNKTFFFIYISSLLFISVSEFFFWEEFGSRFNFIAVDYLIYTREVAGNIAESYPVPIILGIIGVTAFIIQFIYNKIISNIIKHVNYQSRLKLFVIFLSLAAASFGIYNNKITDITSNRYASELAKNGIYNFFSAYKNNDLSYEKFYQVIDPNLAHDILRKEVIEGEQKFLNDKTITRSIKYEAAPNKLNVMLVVVESLSKIFLDEKYENKSITPFINSILKDSIVFENFYATGTRTVRGLEAISLSVPPSPGTSIVRKPKNEGLFNISTIFNQYGYESKFLYGGYGYFDNMNYFFGSNGFKVFDRKNIDDSKVYFSTIWGVADEILFDKAIEEADESYKENKPFLNFIMTTSNHRPYTYPDNKIDIPSGTGRAGAVKYTDFAIEQLIKKSRSKKWFDNTIFIITADHCASSGGKTNIPIDRYHIPLIIYSPKHIKPQVISKITSQIDLAPTILGLLNMSYESKFIGNDALKKEHKERLFMSTFQLLGFYENQKFAVLGPMNSKWLYEVKDMKDQKEIELDNNFLNKAISYYQESYRRFHNGEMK